MKEKIEKRKKFLIGMLIALVMLTANMSGCLGIGNEPKENDENNPQPPITPTYYNLIIKVVGQGTTNPTTGAHSYLKGTKVNLTADPSPGWEFDYWSDDIHKFQNPINITMTSNKTVTANFYKKRTPPPPYYTLTITIDGQGTTNPASGTHSYLKDSSVIITATASAGYKFDHWSGDTAGTQNPVTIPMSSNKTVKAWFVEKPVYYELAIKVSGDGTTNPAPGNHTYLKGTQVSIAAILSTNWQFDYWSGDADGNQNSTTITIDSDKEITARFAPPYKVYGLDFGPYTKSGQNPNYGTIISEEQIRELIKVIKKYTTWIRTYGTERGLENVGRIAHENGLSVAIGAWLSKDLAANERQVANLITIANDGEADMLIVGNEVMLRGELNSSQVIGYINRVKENTSGIPVVASDVYGEFLEHPEIMNASDIILANCYPYWERISIDYAVYNINLRYQQLLAAAGNKKVMIAETGWPSSGDTMGDAVPSPENANFFFLNFISWANTENVSYFYFEAFDEPWKVNYEGPKGAHWGVWDKNGYLKPGMERVFNGESTLNNWGTKIIDGPGNPTIKFTHVPPYGSYEDLKGDVSHVSSSDYRVAVYIKVGNGWWTKPFWDNPLTIILPNGNWICDITTGGQDSQATEIIAFLLPVSYGPPLMRGGSILPQGLYDNALAYVNVTRSL